MVTGRKTVNKTTTGTTRKRTPAAKRTPRKKTVEAKLESVATDLGVLDLGDSLVISNVLEWHQKIVPIFDGAEKIILDGSKIDQIDGTGLQLLAALIKEAGTKGIDVAWKGNSETLRDAAAQLGLSGVLCLDATAG